MINCQSNITLCSGISKKIYELDIGDCVEGTSCCMCVESLCHEVVEGCETYYEIRRHSYRSRKNKECVALLCPGTYVKVVRTDVYPREVGFLPVSSLDPTIHKLVGRCNSCETYNFRIRTVEKCGVNICSLTFKYNTSCANCEPCDGCFEEEFNKCVEINIGGCIIMRQGCCESDQGFTKLRAAYTWV